MSDWKPDPNAQAAAGWMLFAVCLFGALCILFFLYGCQFTYSPDLRAFNRCEPVDASVNTLSSRLK